MQREDLLENSRINEIVAEARETGYMVTDDQCTYVAAGIRLKELHHWKEFIVRVGIYDLISVLAPNKGLARRAFDEILGPDWQEEIRLWKILVANEQVSAQG